MCQAQKMPLDLAHHTELSKQVVKELDKYFYYINANEVPGQRAFAQNHDIFTHEKIVAAMVT